MNPQLTFIAKIVIASLILSLTIKYLGPLLPIPASDLSALVAVFIPPIFLGIALWWRGQQNNEQT